MEMRDIEQIKIKLINIIENEQKLSKTEISVLLGQLVKHYIDY